MRELKFNPGDVIIQENTIGSSAFILKSGSVDVVKKGKNQNIILATLNAKEIFGELGLIDDRPRSASIIAKTEVVVDEIEREDFFSLLDKRAAFVIPIFKSLFERLRQTNEMVVRLENQLSKIGPVESEKKSFRIVIDGLTPQTKSVLHSRAMTLTKFPFKIGRACSHVSKDIFVDNDIYIEDEPPFMISRNHLSVNFAENKYYILDRGSSMGTIVNDAYLGGKTGNFKELLKPGDNLIILGTIASPFKFKIKLE